MSTQDKFSKAHNMRDEGTHVSIEAANREATGSQEIVGVEKT